MFYVDFPDSSFEDLSLTIYFKGCNLQCEYCNHNKMLNTKKLQKFNNLNKLLMFMDENKEYYDKVVLSGGEPTLDLKSLLELIVKAKTLNKEVILYTNILNLEESFINVLDKIVVDIKGFDADYISKICKIDYLLALSLINKYHRHKQNDKFLFRINRKLFEENEQYIKTHYKNYEVYDLEVI